MTSTAIGFVGLGNMGAVMSARLVAGGFTVHGHDISPSARAALADAGGLACDTLGDAVEAGWSRLEKRPDVQPNPNAIGGDKTSSPSR